MLIMRFYKLTDSAHAELVAEIKTRRALAEAPAGQPAPSPAGQR
jgi:Na+/melibiose symporter-like transporter